MKYFELLRYVFKRFSIRSAVRTALPTTWYYVRRPTLQKSEKPALFTMNILPPMLTVWHHFAKKALGDSVDIVAFDCSGNVDATKLPGMKVQKFLNFYAATKTDEFLYHIAKNRKLGWMCDDDMFLLSPKCLERIQQEFTDPKTASLSFRARPWWHFEINGKQYQPSSSYCTVINRDIYCTKKHLTLGPRDGNNHPSHVTGKPVGRYDTFDWANEQLIHKGYRCAIVPKEEEQTYVTGFSGVSGGVMLLSYFKTAEQTMRFFTEREDANWKGNILYGTLGAMLAISTIQDLHEKITGWRYPLPSLPSRADLDRLRKEKEPLMREGQDYASVDETAEQLWKAL